MANNDDAKKVFLSHKGVNKDMVREYKETLEVLGYEPWLDEEAMPLGTVLGRGLQQGMKDSCGVVFFITREFEDKGYLKTEIDHAELQKEEKGDKFAIITLLLDEEAKIPDPLSRYVWGEPKTQFEALRGIVQALPVMPGKVDWREVFTNASFAFNTVDMPWSVPVIYDSQRLSISVEAGEILKRAAEVEGTVIHANYKTGEYRERDTKITVRDKNMIPDQGHRTVQLWKGALEELLSHGFIEAEFPEPCGRYQLTTKGYEATDNRPDEAEGAEPTPLGLSIEAGEILKEAKRATEQGETEIYANYEADLFGERDAIIQVGKEDKNMIPDQGHRTVQLWKDALKELLSRGFIESKIRSRYELTFEGHKAAEHLLA